MATPISTIGIGAAAAVLLSACATVPPRYAYYQVPCTTPGAVLATPVAGAAQIPVAPGYPPPAGSAVAPGPAGAPGVATCIVAVRDEPYGYYGAPYYSRYGYGPYGYGSPFYGSFGLGFGFSSHHHHFSDHFHHSGGHIH